MSWPLYAITQHDGAIPIGEFPSKSARDARLRVERDYHATLGDGEVLDIVTELPVAHTRSGEATFTQEAMNL